jgi:hypothetical protein
MARESSGGNSYHESPTVSPSRFAKSMVGIIVAGVTRANAVPIETFPGTEIPASGVATGVSRAVISHREVPKNQGLVELPREFGLPLYALIGLCFPSAVLSGFRYGLLKVAEQLVESDHGIRMADGLGSKVAVILKRNSCQFIVWKVFWLESQFVMVRHRSWLR